MLHYYQYRLRAFKVELQELRKQLEQFTLLVSAMFFIYLPSLVMAIFFGLGKLVESESVRLTLEVSFGFLLMQSLLIETVKSAILDSARRTFHHTLLSNRVHKFIADNSLLLMCHLLFIAAFIMAASMGWAKLLQAPQLLLFMASQFMLAVVQLYRPHATILTLSVALGLVFVSNSVAMYFIFVLTVMTVGVFINPRLIDFKVRAITANGFWLQLIIEKPWMILWRLGVSTLTYWCTQIIVTERPDLAAYYSLMALLFNLLWWSSLLLETNKQIVIHRGFWQSLAMLEVMQRSQNLVVMLCTSVAWLIGVALFGVSVFELIILLVTPLMMLTIVKRPKSLALVWATLVIAIMLSKVLFG
ncbi:DUF6136 family protein [Pseudoalteromonas luteoviolacea]|uniref:Uncharacterized protein n=1 Tax=Pseudoalteromonas luteoviolacea S4060-1 TaxID=1365257 RepID=A0A167LVC9_9GAMM|nr:DUF6136 family protein [Pseudoalteromonas luteoviolacea]KZN65328.1 hypothetical protein N478_21365 [Pseudoalteromonas luteoviolacea S4060-1]